MLRVPLICLLCHGQLFASDSESVDDSPLSRELQVPPRAIKIDVGLPHNNRLGTVYQRSGRGIADKFFEVIVLLGELSYSVTGMVFLYAEGKHGGSNVQEAHKTYQNCLKEEGRDELDPCKKERNHYDTVDWCGALEFNFMMTFYGLIALASFMSILENLFSKCRRKVRASRCGLLLRYVPSLVSFLLALSAIIFFSLEDACRIGETLQYGLLILFLSASRLIRRICTCCS